MPSRKDTQVLEEEKGIFEGFQWRRERWRTVQQGEVISKI